MTRTIDPVDDARAVVQLAGSLSEAVLTYLVEAGAAGTPTLVARRAAFGQAVAAAEAAGRPWRAWWLSAYDTAARRQVEVARVSSSWVTAFDLSWAGARCEETTPPWSAGRAVVAALVQDLVSADTYQCLYGVFPKIAHPPAMRAG